MLNSWFTPKGKDDEPTGAPDPMDQRRWLEAPQEFVDEDGDGVDDHLEEWQNQSRPSHVSKARYKKFLAAEENRKKGEELRQQKQEIEARRKELAETYHKRFVAQSQSARAQREAASNKVREHFARLADFGSETRRMLRSARDRAVGVSPVASSPASQRREAAAELLRRKQAVAQQQLAAEARQREKLAQERAEKLEENHATALKVKADERERAQAKAETMEQELRAKQERVAKIREETSSKVVTASKQFFYLQRKEVADDVRESVSSWKVEQEEQGNAQYQKAQAHRREAQRSRDNAIDSRPVMAAKNLQVGRSEREKLSVVAEERRQEQYESDLKARKGFAESFYDRWVNPEQAEELESSPLEKLANAHRNDNESQASSRMTGKTLADRGAWNAFFAKNGFFSSWWSGEIQSTTI